ELWSTLKVLNISTVFYTGMTTNLCLANRPVGPRAAIALGRNAVVVRDLVAGQYKDAEFPVQKHDEANTEYLDWTESFWFPTALGDSEKNGTIVWGLEEPWRDGANVTRDSETLHYRIEELRQQANQFCDARPKDCFPRDLERPY
ncbi:hypothetical protein CYMTET_27865, partial [Cymbomonas tetramitiformis]